MIRHVAFFRGFNLGNRRATAAEVVAAVRTVGVENPATFLASGNLVFDAEPAGDLRDRLEAGLTAGLGFELLVLLRTGDEVQALAAGQPFTDDQLAASDGKVQVSLLRDEPTGDQARELRAMATEADLLHLDGRTLWWLPPEGIARPSLDVDAIERLLGLQTRRTHNTVQRLATKFLAD